MNTEATLLIGQSGDKKINIVFDCRGAVATSYVVEKDFVLISAKIPHGDVRLEIEN